MVEECSRIITSVNILVHLLWIRFINLFVKFYTAMDWNITFSRNRFTSWLAPGYHGEVKNRVGQTITTTSGIHARLVKVEFNLQWKQFSTKEKAFLKKQYGDSVKHDYHRFTRVIFDKVIWEQTYLLQI